MFEGFYGNPHVVQALGRMVDAERIPHALLLAGPEGVGKATLARRLASGLLGHAAQIEKDDLSLPHNVQVVATREKWPADKRNEDPLLFASYPDFTTFAPDGPLRQISIEQMRLLKERAGFQPSSGRRSVFLIDHVDRANEQAANSLLKTLEEPPEHLLLILTAENAYDLLPTIRSRVVLFQLAPLTRDDIEAFLLERRSDSAPRRAALAMGSPGQAITLDLDLYDKRRAAMLTLLRVAAGLEPFGAWMGYSEAISRSKTDKLEFYLKVLYVLLRDLLVLKAGSESPRNTDLAGELEVVAQKVPVKWIRKAAYKTDELMSLLRRNIQKSIALDSLILELRGPGFKR